MVDTKIFVFIISFTLFFNLLIGMFAVSTSDYSGLDLPTLGQAPNILDYIIWVFDYVIVFFQIAFITYTNIPVWIAAVLVTLNAALVLIILQMIRGN
jgi:hypothetical protein